VYTVVKDETKKIISPELTFFCKVLSGDIEKQESVDNVKKIQAVIDKELIEQLSLEKGVATLILADKQLNDHSNQELIDYAMEKGYKNNYQPQHIYKSSVLKNFLRRVLKDYKDYTLGKYSNVKPIIQQVFLIN